MHPLLRWLPPGYEWLGYLGILLGVVFALLLIWMFGDDGKTPVNPPSSPATPLSAPIASPMPPR
jgi:hypothetical protein